MSGAVVFLLWGRSPALCSLCSDLGGSVREDDGPDRPDGQPEERHHGPQHQRAPHAQEPGLPQEGLGDLGQEPGESPGSDTVQLAGSDSSPTHPFRPPVVAVSLRVRVETFWQLYRVNTGYIIDPC